MIEICCSFPLEYTKTTMQLSTQKLTAIQVVKDTLKSPGA